MKKLIAVLFLAVSLPAFSQNIHVMVTGVENSKGKLMLGVFTSNENFKEEKPVKKMSFSKTKFSNGKLSFSLSLEPGTYGLSVYDDENSNQKMDYNWVHIPVEGFGFSDFYLSGMSRPTFDDFKFTVKEGESKRITIKMRYL